MAKLYAANFNGGLEKKNPGSILLKMFAAESAGKGGVLVIKN
jgi:hypothetical protein